MYLDEITYNFRCFRSLMDDSIALPSTLLLIDIHVLIKVINSWSCFDNIAQTTKDFYLCSVIYMSTLTNIDKFNEVVISIFALCQSPNQNSEIEKRRLDLWDKLTSDVIKEINREYLTLATGKNCQRSFSFYNNRQSPIKSETPHDIYDYICQLKQKAFDQCSFSTDNLDLQRNEYYCPLMLENLTQLLIEFPSWTRIFVKKRDCSTLASTCATKHLKTFTELKEPVSPPQFLMYHYEKLSTLVYQGRYILNKLKNNIGHVDFNFQNADFNVPSQQILNTNIVKRFKNSICNKSSLTSGTNLSSSMHTKHLQDNVLENIATYEVNIEKNNVAYNNQLSDNEIIVNETINENHSYNKSLVDLNNKVAENSELNLTDFKSAVDIAIRSLIDFDEYLNKVLLPLIKPGSELNICKTLLNCCTEMKIYEHFFSNIVEVIIKKYNLYFNLLVFLNHISDKIF